MQINDNMAQKDEEDFRGHAPKKIVLTAVPAMCVIVFVLLYQSPGVSGDF